ncbi:MAG: hypothetical protein H7276_10720 [Caulobacter sp.]|nr:hypothetical protein [Vitreoscilla sp.]
MLASVETPATDRSTLEAADRRVNLEESGCIRIERLHLRSENCRCRPLCVVLNHGKFDVPLLSAALLKTTQSFAMENETEISNLRRPNECSPELAG